jgi:hypothetical protein
MAAVIPRDGNPPIFVRCRSVNLVRTLHDSHKVFTYLFNAPEPKRFFESIARSQVVREIIDGPSVVIHVVSHLLPGLQEVLDGYMRRPPASMKFGSQIIQYLSFLLCPHSASSSPYQTGVIAVGMKQAWSLTNTYAKSLPAGRAERARLRSGKQAGGI